jgi:hypothetical protein
MSISRASQRAAPKSRPAELHEIKHDGVCERSYLRICTTFAEVLGSQ